MCPIYAGMLLLVVSKAKIGTNSPVEHYTGGHGMSYSLGEQFCTDGYCQGVQARMTGDESALMSETDQFWEYAKEAMLLACDAKIAKDKQDLLELSGTWTQAALQSRSRQLGEVSAA